MIETNEQYLARVANVSILALAGAEYHEKIETAVQAVMAGHRPEDGLDEDELYLVGFIAGRREELRDAAN